MFTVTYCLLVLKQIFFFGLIFSTHFTFAFNLSQRSLEWLQLNMLMIFQSSVERKQVAELKQWWEINITVLDSQRYMDQGIKNSLRCCADTALPRHKRFVLYPLQRAAHKEKPKGHTHSVVLQAVWCSSPFQVFGCVVSALCHVLATFFISLTCVLVRKIFWKKASSCFLTPVLMAGGGSVSEGALADFDYCSVSMSSQALLPV